LNVLVDEIKAITRRKGIRTVSFSPSTVKKFITGNGWVASLFGAICPIYLLVFWAGRGAG